MSEGNCGRHHGAGKVHSSFAETSSRHRYRHWLDTRFNSILNSKIPRIGNISRIPSELLSKISEAQFFLVDEDLFIFIPLERSYDVGFVRAGEMGRKMEDSTFQSEGNEIASKFSSNRILVVINGDILGAVDLARKFLDR